MAKEQGLSLNPTKISGTCGRLLCCLKYEQESYEYLNKITPRVGSVVDTKEGKGTVTESNLLTGKLKVCLDRRPEALPAEYNRKEVKLVRKPKVTSEPENEPDLVE
jgi:cell fate regulator YaaT (PSP1 superfamily)